jgi:hypothetical protein
MRCEMDVLLHHVAPALNVGLGPVVETVTTAAARQGPSPSVGMFKAVFVVTIVHILVIACCTAIVMFHMTRLTKAVLRRIEAIRQ